MLYNNGYPLYVYNDASDVDLRRRGTKKNPGAMKLVLKKVPAPESDGTLHDLKLSLLLNLRWMHSSNLSLF